MVMQAKLMRSNSNGHSNQRGQRAQEKGTMKTACRYPDHRQQHSVQM